MYVSFFTRRFIFISFQIHTQSLSLYASLILTSSLIIFYAIRITKCVCMLYNLTHSGPSDEGNSTCHRVRFCTTSRVLRIQLACALHHVGGSTIE